MSHPPLAGCLIFCLLTLAPAATARAEDGGPSPRRRAEIDALIARRRAEKLMRGHRAAVRAAETAHQLSEARAYEISLIQSFAAYQMSVERQTMMQQYRIDRAIRSTSPQSYDTPFAGTAVPGVLPYTSGPVFVNFNPPGPASGAYHESPAHSGGSAREERPAHADHHVEAHVHQGHAR